MTTYTQSETITVDGIDFRAILWFDDSDDTVDIESFAVVATPVEGTKWSNYTEVEANIYTVPIATWDSEFVEAARAAIATV